MQITSNALAAKIRAARTRAKLTQNEVADHLGVGRTAVVKWESANVRQNVSPERDRLVEFARLVRTPIEWFFDDSATPEALPPLTGDVVALREAPADNLAGIALITRNFWESVRGGLRARRSDLWGRQIYDPALPDWQRPLTPDILTDRCAAILLAQPRPYYYMFAQRLASLVAFERTQQTPRRLVALAWLPVAPDIPLPPKDQDLIPQFEELQPRIMTLAEHLGVRYIVVQSRSEAIEYLAQLL